MKKTLCAALAASLLCAGASAAPAPLREYDGRFADVPPDAWYADAVETVYEHGLMEGTGAGRFDPDGTLSFAECVMLTARLHSLSHGGDGTFPAGEPWYTGAADYLVRQGVLDADTLALQLTSLGADDPYGAARIIEQPANRAYAADLFAQALPQEQLAAINKVDVIPDFPQNALANARVWQNTLKLYNAGVLTGNDAWGSFGLSDRLTRAEAAALAARLAEPALRQTVTLRELPFTLTRLDTEALGVASVYPLGEGLYGALTAPADGGEPLCGLLDARGKQLLPPEYRYLEPGFSVHEGYGYACRADDSEAVIFDTEGRVTARLPRAGGKPFLPETGANAAYGYFRFRTAGGDDMRWGLLDHTGRVVLPAEYTDVSALSETRFAAARTQTANTAQPLYALYDESGKALTDATYVTLANAGEGLFLAEDAQGRFGYLDADGHAAVPLTLREAGRFSDGLAPVTDADGSLFYLTPAGEARLRDVCARYDAVSGFEDGFASVQRGAAYGLMNLKGEEVVPAAQPGAPKRAGDLLAVPAESGLRYLGLDGSPAVAPAWRDPFTLTFSEGYGYGAAEGGGAAYFTPDGTQVTPAMFPPRTSSQTGALHGGAAIVGLAGLGGDYLLTLK